MPFDANRAVVISLHDVSPGAWPACRQILTELANLGIPCVSLLVVPNHHGQEPLAAHTGFGDWLGAQVCLGHEPVLHGYYHQREKKPNEGPLARLTTTVYTAGEGEFYDLPQAEARLLVERGLADFQAIGLHPRGFIAPAWLLSPEAETALREMQLDYTTRLGSVSDLPTNRIWQSQSLVWSVRSKWRRLVSRGWNRWLARLLERNQLLRISIHPVDLAHPAVWLQITQLVKSAVSSHEPMTYLEWVKRWRDASTT